MDQERLEQYSYLLNFYDKAALDKYLLSNDLEELYNQCLPQECCIGDLEDPNNFILVESPDGFVPVKSLVKKAPAEILSVSFSNGTNIKTSPFHMFESAKTPGTFLATVNLVPGIEILSKGGPITVTSVTDTGEKQYIYDLAVNHVNHRYYTDEVSSHNSGAGKSIFLQNQAVNWVEMGYNVVYLSLELSEKLCAMRLDAMIANYSTTEVLKNIEDVALRVKSLHKGKKGNLTIKQMPNGSTANDIRAYIKEFEIQKGYKVDAILLDYLDLCMPYSVKVNPSDQFVKDKYVSEELRNLATELNVLFVTASQLNRSSHEEVEYDHSHIAGGISKINTADNVMAIFVTPSMKESGRYQIQFLKTRSSSGVGSKVDLKFNVKSLRISDLDENEAGAIEQSTSSIMDSLKRKSVMSTGTDYTAPKSSSSSQDVLEKSAQLRALLSKK